MHTARPDDHSLARSLFISRRLTVSLSSPSPVAGLPSPGRRHRYNTPARDYYYYSQLPRPSPPSRLVVRCVVVVNGPTTAPPVRARSQYFPTPPRAAVAVLLLYGTRARVCVCGAPPCRRLGPGGAAVAHDRRGPAGRAIQHRRAPTFVAVYIYIYSLYTCIIYVYTHARAALSYVRTGRAVVAVPFTGYRTPL